MEDFTLLPHSNSNISKSYAPHSNFCDSVLVQVKMPKLGGTIVPLQVLKISVLPFLDTVFATFEQFWSRFART